MTEVMPLSDDCPPACVVDVSTDSAGAACDGPAPSSATVRSADCLCLWPPALSADPPSLHPNASFAFCAASTDALDPPEGLGAPAGGKPRCLPPPSYPSAAAAAAPGPAEIWDPPQLRFGSA